MFYFCNEVDKYVNPQNPIVKYMIYATRYLVLVTNYTINPEGTLQDQLKCKVYGT